MTAVDLYAELVVAACAAASSRGAALAHDRLEAWEFTSPTFRAIFTASAEILDMSMPSEAAAAEWARARVLGEQPESIWPSELRLQEVAARLAVPVAEIVELAGRRPVFADETGLYAGRVRGAARRRRVQDQVVDLHELVRDPDGDPQQAARIASSIADELAGAG